MDTEPAKKKRRLRPSSETVRSRAEKASQTIEKPSVEQQRKPKAPSKFTTPFRAVARPFKWLGRHVIPRYIRDAFKELSQVTWPGLKQSRQLTTAVLMFGIVFGFVVSILDYELDKVFKKVFLHE